MHKEGISHGRKDIQDNRIHRCFFSGHRDLRVSRRYRCRNSFDHKRRKTAWQPFQPHYLSQTKIQKTHVLSFHMRLFFCLFLSLFLQLISDLSRLIRIVGDQGIHAQFTEFFHVFFFVHGPHMHLQLFFPAVFQKIRIL